MSKPVHTPVQSSDRENADLQERSSLSQPIAPKKRAKRRFDKRAQTAFCALTAEGMSCAAATRELGYSRDTPYAVARQDEAFRAAWNQARETGADYLEDVAYKLATEGGEDVEYDGNGNVRRRTKRAPNPAILARVLGAWRPERWGDRPTQVGVGIALHLDPDAERVRHEARLTLAELVRNARVEYPIGHPGRREEAAIERAPLALSPADELHEPVDAASARADFEWREHLRQMQLERDTGQR